MNNETLTVYAPASSGNLSVGFDASAWPLLQWMAVCWVIVSALCPVSRMTGCLCMDGPFAHALPQDQEQNIVITSCRRFEQAARATGALKYIR